jgi:hypothetical protein
LQRIPRGKADRVPFKFEDLERSHFRQADGQLPDLVLRDRKNLERGQLRNIWRQNSQLVTAEIEDFEGFELAKLMLVLA